MGFATAIIDLLGKVNVFGKHKVASRSLYDSAIQQRIQRHLYRHIEVRYAAAKSVDRIANSNDNRSEWLRSLWAQRVPLHVLQRFPFRVMPIHNRLIDHRMPPLDDCDHHAAASRLCVERNHEWTCIKVCHVVRTTYPFAVAMDGVQVAAPGLVATWIIGVPIGAVTGSRSAKILSIAAAPS